MKEVEIKIRIADPEEIIRKLENKGCKFSVPVQQEDIVFIPQSQKSMPVPAGMNVLRIRKQPGKVIFTLKQSIAGNNLAKLEKEIEVGDSETLGQMIMLLGFKKVAHTIKIRQKCRLGEYEICVDEVKELGNYLEMEKITAEEPQQVQKEMLEELMKLGLDISNQIDVGYDVLYVQKYGFPKE